MKVIVPCCGRSSRYPNQPPKWMLPGHDGRPMLAQAISKLAVGLDDVVVAILREHEEKYRVVDGLRAVFGRDLTVVIHEAPTKSQAETVAKTLAQLTGPGGRGAFDEPFLIKDSDNVFAVDDVEQAHNYVCVDSLNNFDSINPRNKSYLQVDHKGNVTNMREKVVISDLFNVGGYYFTRPSQFLEYYERLSANTAAWSRELYISDLIGAMVLDGIPFRARTITGYQDWGTVHEWRRALLARKTYFVLLDGFVFERGSEFFHPRYADVKPNAEAVEALRALVAQGNTLAYLSIRPGTLAALTEAQLEAAGAPKATITYGCPISSYTLVTAPHATLPFRTAHAVELDPSDANLAEKLRGEP
jgi:hypothetical protein